MHRARPAPYLTQEASAGSTPVAVVGRGPHCHQLVIEHGLVAIHDQLVRSADEADLVGLVEAAADVATEKVASATRAEAPALDVLWVRPQQVTHAAIVGHLLLAVDGPDLQQARHADEATPTI